MNGKSCLAAPALGAPRNVKGCAKVLSFLLASSGAGAGFTLAPGAAAEVVQQTSRQPSERAAAHQAIHDTAEPVAEVSLERARELFAAGKASMERGDWREAARRFREAAAIKDTPGLRYHIAHCEENAEQLLRARAEYEAAGRLLEVLPATDVEELLGPALTRLAQKTPEVRVRLVPSAEVTLVAIDGHELADWQAPVQLDPGRHWVQVEAAGHRPTTMEFTLELGQKQILWVRLQPEAPPPTPPSVAASVAATPTPSSWRTPVMITGGAMSLAGLGLGVWALLDRSVALDEAAWARSGVSRLSGAEGSCAGASGGLALACDDLIAAERRRDRATQFALGGFAVAGVGAALTFTSLLVGVDAPVEVSGVSGAGMTGMRVRGRF